MPNELLPTATRGLQPVSNLRDEFFAVLKKNCGVAARIMKASNVQRGPHGDRGTSTFSCRTSTLRLTMAHWISMA
jgi:hypothetical protein